MVTPYMIMVSQGEIRCARCCIVALDIFSAIAREIIGDTTTPDQLFNRINNTQGLLDLLDWTQQQTINTLTTDQFSKLDFTLIYKIVRFFGMYIPRPSQKWGESPQINMTTIGDDFERMRIKRNHLFHKPNSEMSEREFEDFFLLFVPVGQRVDTYLRKTTSSGYEVTIRSYKSCHLDTDVYEKYLEERKERERLEELINVSSNEKVVHVLVGKTVRDIVEHVKKLNEEGTTKLKFIIQGPGIEQNETELIEQLTSDGSISSENIKLISATKECIALVVEVNNIIIPDDTVFLKEISRFIEHVFSISTFKCLAGHEYTAILTSTENESDIFTNSAGNFNDDSPQFQNQNTIVLNLDVKNKVFESDETLTQNIDEFVCELLTKTNGKELIKDKEITAVLTKEDDASNIKEVALCKENTDNACEAQCLSKESKHLKQKRSTLYRAGEYTELIEIKDITPCADSVTKQTIERLQYVETIVKNEIISDIDGQTRMGKCFAIIVEVCKDMILDFVKSRVCSSKVSLEQFIRNDPDISNDNMVQEALKSMTSPDDLDISVLCLVIKNGNNKTVLRAYEKKSQGHTMNTVGDLIDRIRIQRNEIAHAGKASLCEADYADNIAEYKDIGTKFEIINGKTIGEYTKRIETIDKTPWAESVVQQKIERYQQYVQTIVKYEFIPVLPPDWIDNLFTCRNTKGRAKAKPGPSAAELGKAVARPVVGLIGFVRGFGEEFKK